MLIKQYFEHRLEGLGALGIAVQTDNLAQLIALLGLGIDPNECQDMASSALTLAVQRRALAAAAVLLAHGANAQGSLYEDETPICVAVRKDDVSMVRLLLAFGASTAERPDERAGSPLKLVKSSLMRSVILAPKDSIDEVKPDAETE